MFVLGSSLSGTFLFLRAAVDGEVHGDLKPHAAQHAECDGGVEHPGDLDEERDEAGDEEQRADDDHDGVGDPDPLDDVDEARGEAVVLAEDHAQGDGEQDDKVADAEDVEDQQGEARSERVLALGDCFDEDDNDDGDDCGAVEAPVDVVEAALVEGVYEDAEAGAPQEEPAGVERECEEEGGGDDEGGEGVRVHGDKVGGGARGDEDDAGDEDEDEVAGQDERGDDVGEGEWVGGDVAEEAEELEGPGEDGEDAEDQHGDGSAHRGHPAHGAEDRDVQRREIAVAHLDAPAIIILVDVHTKR